MDFVVSCSPKAPYSGTSSLPVKRESVFGSCELGRLPLELETEEFSPGRGKRAVFQFRTSCNWSLRCLSFLKKKVLNCIKEQRGENVFACDCLIQLRGYKSQRSLKEMAIDT